MKTIKISGHAQPEVRAGHGEAGECEPEGAVQNEGGEEVSALHYEAVGHAAAEVIA